MKVKHIIVGAVIGTSALGLMIHRLAKNIPTNDAKQPASEISPARNVASLKKVSHSKHRKSSESQVSTSKIYG